MKKNKLCRVIGLNAVCIFAAVAVFASEIDIKGRIVGESRQAIEFANIVLQTPDSVFVSGTTTGKDGRFALPKVRTGDYRLVVSSIGYETQAIVLKGYSGNLQLNDIVLAESSVTLGDVTVTASALVTKPDRKVIFPTERIVRISTDGVDLLQQLMLPKITVNRMTNDITVPGGGEVQLRINGVKVEIHDIKALRPADILRVEFHDNPGLRYGNAEVVLDYIVHRAQTGGSFGFDSRQGVNAMWGEHSVNAKMNHKKSEFSARYRFGPRDFYKMWRDNEETFRFVNGTTLHRIEQGTSDRAEMYMHNTNLTYSFQDAKQLFNASIRYNENNNKHWDYQGTLYNKEIPSDKVAMIDRNPSLYQRPSVDLYYQRNMPKDQTLVFNVVGTLNRTDSRRLYQEKRGDRILTDVNNRIDGKKYSVIAEGGYEKKFGGNRLGLGIRHDQSLSDNDYRNGRSHTTRMRQADTYLYTEWKGTIRKFDYTLGMALSRYDSHQEETNHTYEYHHLRPKISLQYHFPDQSLVRLRANIGTHSPSLANLGNVEMMIDSLQVQRGNPALKPYRKYGVDLMYEVKKGLFYGNFWGSYEYAPKVIMEEKFWENGKIVQTWNNQRNWQYLTSTLTLRVGPIKEIVQFSFSGGVNHFLSNGNTYAHRYTNWFCEAEVSAAYKNWKLMYMLKTNWNRFFGETMNGGENIQMVGLDYKHKNLSAGIGVFNPFIDNFKLDKENRNRFASYKRSTYIKESSRLFTVNVSYHFSFGRTYSASGKRLNNSDTDAGVMSTGK